MNHNHSTPRCTIKKQKVANCCLKNGSSNGYKWNISAAKRSGKNLQSWTSVQNLGHPWDAPFCYYNASWGMWYVWSIHFACCRALTVEILSREVEKAFWITWLNIVHQIEDEVSSESDKKVEWYSDCHDNLMDNVRLVEEKASTKWDCHRKADEKLVQGNSRIMELEAKLAGLQRELAVLKKQDKRIPIDWGNLFDFSDSELKETSGRSNQKRKKGQAFPPSISYRGFFPDEASMSVPVNEQMLMMPASESAPVVGPLATLLTGHPPTLRIAHGGRVTLRFQ